MCSGRRWYICRDINKTCYFKAIEKYIYQKSSSLRGNSDENHEALFACIEVYRLMATEAEILKILAEERNMRKAKRTSILSQPALSQRLQTIEKDWGAQLFIRSQKV